MRNSFIFYESWWEAIKDLPKDVRGDVLTAIVEYGLTGDTNVQLKPITNALLTMAKAQIDVNNKRYENGKRGGRPKTKPKPNNNQTETKEKPNQNQNITKTEPKRNQTETKEKPNKNDNDNVNENVKKENTTDVVSKKGASKDATLARRDIFYQSLVPFVGKYSKEMIRAFFDYWSEMNKSETKMRFELEKTWELPRRLATWAKREKVNKKPEVGIILTDNSPDKYTQGW